MNCPEVQPFVEEYASICGPKPSVVDWFQSRIWNLHMEGDPRVTTEYHCHEVRVKVLEAIKDTKKRQRRRKTQNSGIVVKGDEESG